MKAIKESSDRFAVGRMDWRGAEVGTRRPQRGRSQRSRGRGRMMVVAVAMERNLNIHLKVNNYKLH